MTTQSDAYQNPGEVLIRLSRSAAINPPRFNSLGGEVIPREDILRESAFGR